MDYYTAAEVLEEVMENEDLEDEQIEALEVAIELLKDHSGDDY